MVKKKTLKLNILSQSSIKNLQSQLQEYVNSLNTKAELLLRRLTQEGVHIAKFQISDLDAIFTGELINSIHAEKVSNENSRVVFAIVSDSDHAIYVEMGTGFVGASNPYPGKLPAVYAQGKTIRQLSGGRYGWFYQDDNGNWWFTEGMSSRPFMYNTSLELYEKVEEIAKEIFGE